MAKFSIRHPRSRGKPAPNTVNFEGGRAFTRTAKLELVSVLLTTFTSTTDRPSLLKQGAAGRVAVRQ